MDRYLQEMTHLIRTDREAYTRELRSHFDPLLGFRFCHDASDLFLDRTLKISRKSHLSYDQRQRGQVHYEPLPVRLALLGLDHLKVSRGDKVFDVGCGRGRLVALGALATDAEIIGREIMSDLYEEARKMIVRNGIESARVELGDVIEQELAGINVFVMFTPIYGKAFEDFLARVKDHSANQPLAIMSCGDCTVDLTKHSWLKLDSGIGRAGRYELNIFYSDRAGFESRR